MSLCLAGRFRIFGTEAAKSSGQIKWADLNLIVETLSEFLGDESGPIPMSLWFANSQLFSSNPNEELIAACTFTANEILRFDPERWIRLSRNVDEPYASAFCEKISRDKRWTGSGDFFRNDPTDSRFTVALFTLKPIPEEHVAFLAQLIRTISQALQTRIVFEEIQKQERETARRMAYMGHYLKTPFESILRSAKELQRICNSNGVVASVKIKPFVDRITARATSAFVDALTD